MFVMGFVLAFLVYIQTWLVTIDFSEDIGYESEGFIGIMAIFLITAHIFLPCAMLFNIQMMIKWGM